MEKLEDKVICECGEKTVAQAVEIFKHTDLPYKKAKKLVTGCNQTCCRRPLMALFNMIEFGEYNSPNMINFGELNNIFLSLEKLVM